MKCIVVLLFFGDIILLGMAQSWFEMDMKLHQNRHRNKFLQISKGAAGAEDCAEESYFTQILDHFDNKSTVTWNQRYQINDKYFDTAKNSSFVGPAIVLHIGGEQETIDERVICYEIFPMVKMAKQHNALLIQLEHRFFGKSFPIIKNGSMADMSVPTLRQFLTVQQALEDLANFIRNFKYKNVEWKNPKWILFGGSYSGSLCAWSRAKYPDLTVGGICSSAPIWPKMDFFEYSQVMEFAITNYSAIKYPNCAKSVTNGFTQLRQMSYTDDGRNTLNNLFNITPPLNPKTSADINFDIQNFHASVFSPFVNIVQYNYDYAYLSTSKYNIDKVCKKFSTTPDPIKAIRDIFFGEFSDSDGNIPTQFLNNYVASIIGYKQTAYNFSDARIARFLMYRGWTWLTCGSALGWLQTTDNTNGMFSQMKPLSKIVQLCTDIFDSSINADYISKKVAETELQFPRNYSATNVVLTNGDYDPWSALGGFTTNEKMHQFSVITHGAAHCADSHQYISGEPVGLQNTRNFIEKEVAYYLNTTISSSSTSSTISLFVSLILFLLCGILL